MADPLRVAVIGVGAMGANHVRVFGELPEAELVAVADADEARLQHAARDRSLRAYGSYGELLAQERLDAVSIAVPTRLHVEVALACIERGVAVLVEKPLAAAVADGERLRAAVDASGVALVVGHVERFNPAVQELKRRLDGGEAGRVLQARARRVGPFFQRGRDVGVVYDLATHDIDVFRYLLGCDVERVQAETQSGIRTEYEDALAGVLRFESGVIAALEVNWLTPVKVRELSVLGERGMFVVDYLTQELRFYAADAHEGGDGRGRPALSAFPDAGQAPLRAELAAFLRVARGEALPVVSAGDAIAAMRVADALVESARCGAAVELGVERPVL